MPFKKKEKTEEELAGAETTLTNEQQAFGGDELAQLKARVEKLEREMAHVKYIQRTSG